MKIKTRQKIINKAIQLFNKNGYASVSLFEIAGVLDMTRGNLTYHFKDKDILLKAISNEFWAKIEVERQKTRMLPSFENMHNEVQLFYRFQKEYAFIFLDSHVINQPIIRKKFQEMMNQSIREMEATIAFAISAGNMPPEPFEGIYHNLAFNFWMTWYYWINVQTVTGDKSKKTNEEGERRLWSLLLPYLTEKGLKAFRKFFGDDYIKKLGKSFNTDLGAYVKF